MFRVNRPDWCRTIFARIFFSFVGHRPAAATAAAAAAAAVAAVAAAAMIAESVSYTHLTLPTILLV